MRTSKNGINSIKQFEGCRLTAYRCAAGKWTIGYGHTAGVVAGQSITQEQAESLLIDDLERFEQNVMKFDSIYHWNQNEFDALVSFAFNLGSINELVKNGSRTKEEIANKIPAYNKTAGKVCSGLIKRRAEEKKLFLKPVSCTGATMQAASVEPAHVQLNYQVGQPYEVVATGLRIRTKKASQTPDVLPDSDSLGTIKKGTIIKNLATARVKDAIWMYFGLDKYGREQWVCADTGMKTYIL